MIPLLAASQLITDTRHYNDAHLETLGQQLIHRIQLQPINLLFLICFFLAIIHTFIAHRFYILANKSEPSTYPKQKIGVQQPGFYFDEGLSQHRNIKAELLDFLGELEVVFGVWCIPLILAMTFTYGWQGAIDYINSHNYNEALFMVVAMSVAATYPITYLAESLLKKLVKYFRDTPATWWFLIMTLGPLLGSLIKETVAMAISALLLRKYFYKFHPTPRLAYATLGLLLVNVSVGGMLTNFATSAVSIAAKPWGWDSLYMFTTFGWKAVLGILTSNILYFILLRKEFHLLNAEAAAYAWDSEQAQEMHVPTWIICANVFALAWLVFNNTNPVISLCSFALFLGFYQATAPHQKFMNLRDPIMVGFFIASVILMGGLQVWWIGPIVSHLDEFLSMKVMITLSAFTPNTTLTYVLTKIDHLSESVKYALFCSVMIGGGLTIIANGTNLVAVSLLKREYNFQINLGKVFTAALIPTLIMYLLYALPL